MYKLSKTGELTTKQFWAMIKPEEQYLNRFDIEVLELMLKKSDKIIIKNVLRKKKLEKLNDIV